MGAGHDDRYGNVSEWSRCPRFIRLRNPELHFDFGRTWEFPGAMPIRDMGYCTSLTFDLDNQVCEPY